MIAAILVLAASGAFAQKVGSGAVVYFKDGSKTAGIITELTDDAVGLETSGMRMTWPRDQVDRVVAKQTTEERFLAMRRAAGTDPKRLTQAAAFAREHGLHTYYAELAEQLGLAPERVAAVPAGAPSPINRAPTVRQSPAPEAPAPVAAPAPAAATNVYFSTSPTGVAYPAPPPNTPPADADFIPFGPLDVQSQEYRDSREEERRHRHDHDHDHDRDSDHDHDDAGIVSKLQIGR